MKNIFLSALATASILTSCSNVKNITNNGKVAQQQRVEFLKMKGDWEISSINYDKSFKIKPFDEGADAKCFVGSRWHLIPNNYTGSYTINAGSDCPSVTQPIKFEVLNGSQFQFKKVDAGVKAKTITSGYVLNLINQSENQFTLEQNIPFEGQILKVTYNFQKISTTK